MSHYQAGNGVLSHEELKNALAAAAQRGTISTQWSIIYDQSALRLAFTTAWILTILFTLTLARNPTENEGIGLLDACGLI